MKISVIGCGYLGAVHAAAMAHLGHSVVGIDLDPARVASLQRGAAPFFEPELDDLLAAGVASGRLSFSTDLESVRGVDAHFLAVGTPQRREGDGAELRFVDEAVASLVPHLEPGSLVVGKSTVPVGTAARLAEIVEAAGATLLWNPEFLREGFAVADTLRPDRLVYGVRDGDTASVELLDRIYASALATGAPRLVTDFATAELVKVSANAFLATKISFINAMAEIAEATGADVTQLADAIGHDVRIGRRFLNSGVGFGGGCLPKDIRAFAARAEELGLGASVRFLREVDDINLRRRARVVEMAEQALGGDVVGRRVAVLGLAFKPDSDDVRDSPALAVARRLAELGAQVIATDPRAVGTASAVAPELDYVADAAAAAAGADLIILLTEWVDYRELDPTVLASAVGRQVIIDARNCLDATAWRAAGWDYRAPGRP